MALPTISTYNFKALSLGCSDLYLAIYNDKSEEPGKGTLYLHEYPSMVLFKSLVIFTKVFPRIIQLTLVQGYLLTITSSFQVFSLHDFSIL